MCESYAICEMQYAKNRRKQNPQYAPMHVTSVKTQKSSNRKASLSMSFLIYSSGTSFAAAACPSFA